MYWRFAQNTLRETKIRIYTPKRDNEHPCPFHMGGAPRQTLRTYDMLN